ncbi:xanthine dehydrogenase family protein molybdopterin-binding subunit [Hoeflea poritis]|uniref:Xanthine dehydrogenase family protein molybdopterin-binding subunit n=1 Tax=Hoeflea poritis TaxID=2993659 RepID=A0ABT4VUZ6_9HYPH|nr:xanthine dehydrogenase family protein molybdopterin-binding subunit [Hoeflea poritis]MDA4848541.1 xanthine dehydrogenase family protein molybdopterin-binding subunit [Hoeflea poritis]
MNERVKTPEGRPYYKEIGTRPIRPDGVEKVTGSARFGDDFTLPGTLVGKILRSPHPHARLISVDTSNAKKIAGVKAIVTGSDFPDQPFAYTGPAVLERNMWHVTRNVIAREKVLYEGHAVAAVAAVDEKTASAALQAIAVEYEILPHVTTLDEALAPDAVLLFEDMITRGVEPAPEKPTNIARRANYEKGQIDTAWSSADLIVERSYETKPVHQGYIEPHACLAHYHPDGQADLYTSSQGHFQMRALTATLTGMRLTDIRAIPAEIGGGFGGKTVVYLEPLAMMLSKMSGFPVRMKMTRSEVFKASGPAAGTKARIKLGAKKNGTLVAAEVEMYYEAGAFPGSPFVNGVLCCVAPYTIPNVRLTGWDVVANRPKVAAYRAPGSPQSNFAFESTVDIVCKKLGLDPIAFRKMNAVQVGAELLGGRQLNHEGYLQLLEATERHPQYATELGPNQGRGFAAGYWPNAGGESGATVYVNADGTVNIATGSPDIGGSRASMAQMTAETLGISYDRVRSAVNDTTSVPFTHVTGGSRVTFATGKAVVAACETVIADLRARAAKIWDVDVDAVDWREGAAHPSSSNVGDFDPLTLGDLAARATETGGPIGSSGALNATGHAPGFSAALCDVEVDPETGHVKIIRFTVAQDAGVAIHPSYVEGQMQGAVVQGIGWALSEEYIYGPDGRLQNHGFLDYRMPVASDLPMIDPIVVEVPNPDHPFGVKGVAEAGMVTAMASVANAVADAVDRRMTSLPISPPKLAKEIAAGKAAM